MSKRPENSEPLRSADRIEDPDQPVDVHGKDHKEHGHHFWHRGSKGATARSAAAGTGQDLPREDPPREETLVGTPEHGAGGRHPRKVLKETGFPNVDPAEVEALHGRDIDTGSLAAVRKFQPPPGRPNPNVTQTPDAGHDYAPGEVHEREDTERYGTPRNTPPPEPVRHSRVVEERIRQQEREYDLGETEEGERFVTPHED